MLEIDVLINIIAIDWISLFVCLYNYINFTVFSKCYINDSPQFYSFHRYAKFRFETAL